MSDKSTPQELQASAVSPPYNERQLANFMVSNGQEVIRMVRLVRSDGVEEGGGSSCQTCW